MVAIEICTWTYTEFYDYWDTQCGHAFDIMNGTPKDNKMVYCPYCGKKIKQETGVQNERD